MIVKHIKSGKLYFALGKCPMNCTNGKEKELYVIYFRNPFANIFVREQMEFLNKFKKYKLTEGVKWK